MHLSKMKSTIWHSNLNTKPIKTNCIMLLIGTIYLIWYRLTHLGIPCVFHLVTGLYCPGCGISRMFLALSHFDFAEAFRYNCFVLILLPYGVFIYVRHNVYAIMGKVYNYKKYHRYILNVILVLAIVFGIVRNIPYFYFLRP